MILPETRQLARVLSRHEAFQDIAQAQMFVGGRWAQQDNILEFSYRGNPFLAEVTPEGILLKRPTRFNEVRELRTIIPFGLRDTAGAIALVLNALGMAA